MANDIEHFFRCSFSLVNLIIAFEFPASTPTPPTPHPAFELGSYWLLSSLFLWALYQRHGLPVTSLCFTLSFKEQTPSILMKSNLSDVTFID